MKPDCQSGTWFSAALSRGLIEAMAQHAMLPLAFTTFSAALSRGLIEAPAAPYASACPRLFSAALSRGLIEARKGRDVGSYAPRGFPRL